MLVLHLMQLDYLDEWKKHDQDEQRTAPYLPNILDEQRIAPYLPNILDEQWPRLLFWINRVGGSSLYC